MRRGAGPDDICGKGVKRMRTRQKGVTFISFMILAAMIGLIGFGGLKLVPIYLENMKIRKILNDVKVEFDGQPTTASAVRTAIDKKLNIEMVYSLRARDFEIESTDSGLSVAARYERAEPFIANISLLATFNDEVELRK
ncbi:MAG: hypothetical protein AMXMBFR45_22710 [Gammaproteobacteria bacterium]|nr:MAG: DUF4845 domain-containing protein [Pseudomonadota bacterium]MBC6944131.1 DUF4845 domain-containing protein [Gammaproteobacteria bacterium]GIK33873.1 MAG: hypothetical protein BroJett010_04320 [Gammaproteobacteria bacterium]